MRLHVKYTLFLSDFNENFNFLDILAQNSLIQNFMKISPEGTALYCADGRFNRHT